MDIHKTILVGNLEIFYTEQNPEAQKTIFFFHGNSGSSGTWRKQFSSKLLASYRLIAFDLPGHGRSGPLQQNEDYNLPYIAEVMALAVKACARNNEYILAAFSLGTNIVAEMLVHNLHPKGIVLISPSVVGRLYPLSSISLPGFDGSVMLTDDCPLQMIDNFLRGSCYSTEEADHEGLRDDYRKVQAPFRSMLLKSVVNGKISDEIMLLNENAGVPLLVIFGKEEKVISPDYLDRAPLSVWKHTINKIPGANHYVILDKPDETSELIAEYCRHQFADVAISNSQGRKQNV